MEGLAAMDDQIFALKKLALINWLLGMTEQLPSLRLILAVILYQPKDATPEQLATVALMRADALIDADGRLREKASADGASEFRAMKTILSLYAAIKYTLDRIQEDPDVRHQIGPGAEVFRLLCLAEAAYTGRPVADVEEVRSVDTQPPHRRRRPDVVVMGDYLKATDPDWQSKVKP